MVAPCRILTFAELGALRTELVDLAFELERRRRFDAADVALALEARLRELAETEGPLAPQPAPLHSRFP